MVISTMKSLVSYPFVGCLIQDSDKLISMVLPRDKARLGDPARVIFVCAGPNEAVIRRILQVITIAKQDLIRGAFSVPPEPVGHQQQHGSSYVYAYFDPPQPINAPADCNAAFYVGVGTVADTQPFRGRWLEHINHAVQGNALPRHDRIRSWLQNLELLRLDPMKEAALSGVARKLYKFEGQDFLILKFFTEQFLIGHGYGAHNITNEKGGHEKIEDYRGWSRPRAYDAENKSNEALWRALVQTFLNDPTDGSLGHTLGPGLETLVVSTFLPLLDHNLFNLGLTPIANVHEGRLSTNQIVAPHVNVRGAGECVVTYVPISGAPWRLDLIFDVVRPQFTINLRPIQPTSAGKQAFIAHVRHRVLPAGLSSNGINIKSGPIASHYERDPIRDTKNQPYYKPFAFNSDGRAAGWFPFKWPAKGEIQFHEQLMRLPNWIVNAGHQHALTLPQAVQLLVRAMG